MIGNIEANPSSIGVGESTTLTISVADPDGDVLIITWMCPDGSFSGTSGTSTTWTAPSVGGIYTIKVEARDDGGLTDEDSIDINVDAGSLPRPSVSYDVRNQGGTLYLYWSSVAGAEGYNIYADNQLIQSTTQCEYSATTPAMTYGVSAYNDSSESSRDLIDCTPVITTSITIWGNSDPDPGHPSGVGFSSSGACMTYAVSDSFNWPYIDYYAKDNTFDPVRLTSPNYVSPPINNENNQTSNSGLTNFDALDIAEPPSGSYAQTAALYIYDVYSLWMDPNDNGWDNTVDHFGKARVEDLQGTSPPYRVTLRVAYQVIPGLRWVVTN